MKFNNSDYQFVQTVIYSNYTFSFAAVADGSYNNIVYTFCDTETQESNEDETQAVAEQQTGDDDSVLDDCWTYPMTLDFPMEIRKVGMSLLTEPVYNPETGVPATSVVAAAQAPFQVVVDNLNLWIFRFASNNHAILADRFIFDNTSKRLIKANEIRFVHSGHADIPANNRDNYGASDPSGDDFVEPTLWLELNAKFNSLSFTVLLIPDSTNSKQARWHFFVSYSTIQGLLHYVVPYTERAWFDLSGSNSLTLNLEIMEYDRILISGYTLDHPAITLYEQQETTFVDSGEAQRVQRTVRALLTCHATLIDENSNPGPVLAALDFSVATDGMLTKMPGSNTLVLENIEDYNVVLEMDGRGDAVVMNSYTSLEQTVPGIFISCWIKWNGPNDIASNQTVACFEPYAADSVKPIIFGINNEGYPYLDQEDNGSGGLSIESPIKLIPGQWTNIAFSVGQDSSSDDDKTAYIWINGLYAVKQENTTTSFFSNRYYITLGKTLLSYDEKTSGQDFFNGVFGQFYQINNKVNEDNLATSDSPFIYGSSVNGFSDDFEPVIFWSFGEGEGNQVSNSNENHSTLYGCLQGATWQPDVCPDQPSMPIVYVDENYLNIRGILLDPISPTSSAAVPASNISPSLMKGAEGYVHLYYQDENNHAAVLHMTTATERARFVVSQQVTLDDTGHSEWVDMLTLVARQAGTRGGDLQIIFGSISASGKVFDSVIFQYANDDGVVDAYSEKWFNVPIRPDEFAQVINGDAILPIDSEDNDDPSEVSSEQIASDWGKVIYDYKENVVFSFNGGSLHNTTDDYASRFFEVCVAYGLLEQNPILNLASPEELRWSFYGGRDCGWVMNPLQPVLGLNGNSGPVGKAESALALDIPGNLTVQCWMQRKEDDDGTIINYQGDQASYALRLSSTGQISAERTGFVTGDIAGVTRDSVESLPLNEWVHIAAVYNASFGLHLPAGVYVKCKESDAFNVPEALTVESWVKFDSGLIEAGAIISRRSFEDGKSSYELGVRTDSQNNDTRYLVFKVYLDNGSHFKLQKDFECAADNWVHLAASYRPDFSYNYLYLQDSDHNYLEIEPFTEEVLTSFTIEMYLSARDAEKQTFISQSRIDAGGTYETRNHFQIGLLENNSNLCIEIEDAAISINSNDWSPDSNDWCFISIVVETDADNSYITAYLDGVVATMNDGNPLLRVEMSRKLEGGSVEDFHPWTIGAEWDESGISDYADISIAEARIWTSARTQDQILNNLRTPLMGDEHGLGAYLVFDAAPDSNQNSVSNRVNNTTCKIYTNKEDGSVKWSTNNITAEGNLYVNGSCITTGQVSDLNNNILATDTPLTLGRRAIVESGGSFKHLNGSLDNTRIWRSYRSASQIYYFRANKLTEPEKQFGLVACWNFDEAKGDQLNDPVGGHNGKIVGIRFAQFDDTAILWEPTVFDADWTLYFDGKPIAMTERVLLSEDDTTDSRALLLGTSFGDHSKTIKAYISELQFWSQILSGESIHQYMHQPRVSSDTLMGYYRLNDGSGGRVTDSSGNAADMQIVFADSSTNPDTAWAAYDSGNGTLAVPPPIRDEDLAIINTSNQYVYPEAEALVINSAPSVVEDFANQMRIYSWTCFSTNGVDNGLHLNATVPLSETELVYIGQIQYKPRLIGYIEGAPPVPSENLTIDAPSNPDRYLNNSTVQLQLSESTTLNVSSSLTADVGLSSNLSAGWHSEISSGTAGGTWVGFAGGGTWMGGSAPTIDSTFDKSIKGGLSGDTSFGYQQGASFAQTTAKQYGASLDGGWENNCYKIPGDIANAYTIAGKRLYRPNNMGVAIVKSRTADMYAMRSKKSKAMLGYTVKVNPEIPEDYNIINFRLNPKYVRNGCLDGYVGFDKDEYYENLSGSKKGSYFKPEQAYRMKRNIERETEKVASSLSQYNPFGGASDYYDQLNVSLANTYVWTADAGTFAEEISASASFSEQYSGGINAAGNIGGSIGGKVGVGWGFLSGATVGLDVMASASLKLSYSHSSGEGKSFSLSSNVNSEGFLNRVATFASWTQSLDSSQAEDILNSGSVDTSDSNIIYEAFEAQGIILTPKNRVETSSELGNGPWSLIDLYVEYNITYDDSSSEFTFTYSPTSAANSQYNINYNYADPPCPGKVRGYRYMSLYLTADKSNFRSFFAEGEDQIIEEDWLKSDDPDAIALRQAANQENPVWRVLHRVTYVNRVPPLASEWGETESPETEDVDNRVVRPDEHSVHHNSIIIYRVLAAILPTDVVDSIKDLDLNNLDLNSIDFSLVAAELEAILDLLSITNPTARQIYFDEMMVFFELLFAPDEQSKG